MVNRSPWQAAPTSDGQATRAPSDLVQAERRRLDPMQGSVILRPPSSESSRVGSRLRSCWSSNSTVSIATVAAPARARKADCAWRSPQAWAVGSRTCAAL
jgi:hypothetical protein